MARYSYLKRVILISIAIMLFASFTNASLEIFNEFTSQNGNKWIGPLSISLIFLCYGLASLYNKYINKWRYRTLIVSGAMGWIIYLTFTVMFLFIGFSDWIIVFMIIGSIFCGLLVSVYYNAVNNYVNQCGKRDKRVGIYFAINIGIVQGSNIFGNSLSSLLIKPLGQQNYSLFSLGFSIFICLMYMMFTRQFGKVSNSQDPQSSLIEEEKEESGQQLKIPKSFIVCFALSGISMSFLYSKFSLLFYEYYSEMDNQQLNYFTFVTFMIEGSGELLGGLALALQQLTKRNKKQSLYFLLNGFLFILSVGLIWFGFSYNLAWLIQLGSFFLGFANCYLFASAISIASKWNKSGISLFNFGQSFATALMSVLYIFEDSSYLYIIYAIFFILALFVTVYYRKEIDKEDQQIAYN